MKSKYKIHTRNIIRRIFTSGCGPFTQVLGEFIFLCVRHQQDPIVMTAQTQNFNISNMSFPELPSNFSSQEEILRGYLEYLYPTKSQDGIQIMLNYLIRTRRQQDPFFHLGTCAKLSHFQYVSPQTSIQHIFPRRDVSKFSVEVIFYNGVA